MIVLNRNFVGLDAGGSVLSFGPFPQGTVIRRVRAFFSQTGAGSFAGFVGLAAVLHNGDPPADSTAFQAIGERLVAGGDAIGSQPPAMYGQNTQFFADAAVKETITAPMLELSLNVELQSFSRLSLLAIPADGSGHNVSVSVDAIPPNGKGWPA